VVVVLPQPHQTLKPVMVEPVMGNLVQKDFLVLPAHSSMQALVLFLSHTGQWKQTQQWNSQPGSLMR
jgi:hypothetical protein